MAQLQNTTIDDTGFLKVASGTTDQRPGFVVQVFSATGPGTFTVPSGVTSMDVLIVAGGGAGGGIGGGGGGGGVVYRPALPVSPGQNISYVVGAGGTSGGGYTVAKGNSGQNSTFGSLTALGGGGAGAWASSTPQPGGGSGAGGPGTPGTGTSGGVAQQPAQPNPGATINAGFPGAAGGTNPSSNSTTGAGTYTGGGGGGAGAAGGHPSQTGPGNTSTNNSAGRKGGDGIAVTITGLPQYFGGGGGGGSHISGYQSPVTTSLGGLGGGGRGASFDFQYDAMGFYDFPATSGMVTTHNPRAATNPGPSIQPYGYGEPGQRNTGGGGGGGYHTNVGGDADGGGGGPGVIIVRYKSDSVPAASTGQLRFNTDSQDLELFTGSTWRPVQRHIVEFRATGSHFFKVPAGVTHCDVLVVAGGGSGGVLGGGGGAGGHLYVPNVPVPPGGVVPVYVGTGGSGTIESSGAPPFFMNRKGQPSRFGGYEAYGGGAGSVHPSNQNIYQYPTAGFPTHPGGSGGAASPGGSGGGAAYTHPGGFGYGVPGQGFPGGDTPGSPPHGGGGGGGAGGAGGFGGTSSSGPGGVGVANDITGVSVFRAGGGGGGGHAPTSNGAPGGNGGGGGGGRYNNPVYASVYGVYQQAAGDFASPGQDNTGGGGGGSGHNSSNPYGTGGRGGPGIVIVRY